MFQPVSPYSARDGNRWRHYACARFYRVGGGAWRTIADDLSVSHSEGAYRIQLGDQWILLESKQELSPSKVLSSPRGFGPVLDAATAPASIEWSVSYSEGVSRVDWGWRFDVDDDMRLGLDISDWLADFGTKCAVEGDLVTLDLSAAKASAASIDLDPVAIAGATRYDAGPIEAGTLPDDAIAYDNAALTSSQAASDPEEVGSSYSAGEPDSMTLYRLMLTFDTSAVGGSPSGVSLVLTGAGDLEGCTVYLPTTGSNTVFHDIIAGTSLGNPVYDDVSEYSLDITANFAKSETFKLGLVGNEIADDDLRSVSTDDPALELTYTVPSVPTDVAAVADSATQITVTWTDPSTDAEDQETGFTISHSTNGVDYVELDSVAADETEYVHESLTAGTRHWYKVRSDSTLAGNSAYSTADDTWTIPPAPVISGVTALSSTSLRVSWSDVAGETAYELEQSADGLADWAKVADPTANATSADITGLTASTTYYFRLRAVNASGDGAYSEVEDGTTASSLNYGAMLMSMPQSTNDYRVKRRGRPWQA